LSRNAVYASRTVRTFSSRRARSANALAPIVVNEANVARS
jgi:hypothetical protein